MAGPIATLTVRLSAQIAEFQRDFKDAAKSTQQFQDNFQGVATKAVAIGSAIGIGVTSAVNALQSLGAQILENASNITDLSNQTGLSMGTIQEFQHVAQQTGTTLEAFTNAAFKLGANLAGDNKSVAAAVDRLGLSFASLQQLSPDEQFRRVAQALSEMESPQERNRIALELFGKSAKEILPAISEGYDTLARDAAKMSDETIRRLDEAGDAWARLKNAVVIHSGEMIGALLRVKDQVTSSFQAFEDFTTRLSSVGFAGAIAQTAVQLDVAAEAAERFKKALQNAPKDVAFGAAGTGSQRPGQFGNVNLEAELKRIEEADKRAAEAAKKHAAALQQVRDAAKAMVDELSGAKVQRGVKELANAFETLKAKGNLGADVLQRVGEAADRLLVQGGRLTPELFQLATGTARFSKTIDDLVKKDLPGLLTGLQRPLVPLNEQRVMLPGITQDWISLGDYWRTTFPRDAEIVTDIGEEVNLTLRTMKENLAEVFTSIPQTIANAFTGGGDFLGAIKSIVSQIGAALGSVFGPIGSAVGSLLGQLVEPIRNLFDRNRGRDLVEDFAGSLGGFDALQRRLETLGAEGERLWIRLTQGVGRNNPEQARAAIEAVNEALGRQETRFQNATTVMEEYGFTFADAGEQFRKAKLGEEFDALYEKTLTLREVGIDYDEILRRQASQYSQLLQKAIRTNTEIDASMRPVLQRLVDMGLLVDESGAAIQNLSDVKWAVTLTEGFKSVTDAIRDLPNAMVEAMTGIQNAVRGGVRVPVRLDVDGISPSASGGGVGGNQTINVNLEGRTIAEATAPYQPGVWNLNGV